ncbi:MAG: hypothetical protein PF904_01325 [Kiritimatiellae bacterium]|jgi:hypothetical protein|nr:hypothetical protein [Kiritimatiellia bacterium]
MIFKRIALIITIVLLAAWQSSRLGEIRRSRLSKSNLSYSADVPPALNFIMAGLGGFRGIVSEVLWFRISRLQEEGRYIELVQLSEWITMLDPHASEAWTYNAWNLSYNISIMMLREKDRLRWVKNGISILRDEALRFNPKDPKIYRELAWLYQNKIGSNIDSAHLTYKFDLASTMQPFLNQDGSLKDSPENREGLKALNLDFDLMLKLEQQFCTLDWRIAYSHALYWASQGVDYATGSQILLNRRALYLPLMLMTFNGKFTGNLEQKTWKTAPNYALAAPTAGYMKKTLDEFPTRNMQNMYFRFLEIATKELDNADKKTEATHLYDELCAALPPNTPPPSYHDITTGEAKDFPRN